MSVKSHSCCDPLQYRRESGTGGPTPTFTVQKRFAERLRGVLSRINAAIRTSVAENDLFNLQENTDTLAVDEPGPFETDDSVRKTVLFVSWLREQLDTEFLTIVGPDRNQFIRKAYLAGLRRTNGEIRNLDVGFVPESADDVMGRPIHISALQELFSRTYSNLQNVADDMVTDVRNTLLEGFKEGEGPREIARNLTDRVDSIGKNRATMIARSEVINAHSESTLTRLDEIQEEPDAPSLTVAHGEWDAANDARTCPFCRALDGVPMTTDEMRGTQVNVVSELPGDISQVGQSFRLKPPAHPSGRCNIRIMVGSTPDTPLNERLPNQLQLA